MRICAVWRVLIIFSFMEGARLRSSVALPRVVTKDTEIEDNGEKVTLKAGQQIVCNLVSENYCDFPELFAAREQQC